MRNNPKYAGAVALALIVAVISVVVTLVVVGTDDDPTRQAPPTPSATPVPEETPAAPAGDLESVPPESGPATKEPTDSVLRDETPPDVPKDVLEEGREETEKLAEPLEPIPTGGAQTHECRKDFSGEVYSERLHPPTMWVNHYTVSGNVEGWGDVEAIQSFFKRTRAASSTYIVDFEGHCLQMVPESKKPWTQGSANSASISVEIIATGRETKEQWLNAPIFKQAILASIARDAMRRHGLPFKRVNPEGCVFPPGWTDHNSLECGNDHTDVAPNFPYGTFQKQLEDGPKVPITKRHRDTCRKVNAYRKGERTDKQNQIERLKFIRRAGLKCVAGKPVRR